MELHVYQVIAVTSAMAVHEIIGNPFQVAIGVYAVVL